MSISEPIILISLSLLAGDIRHIVPEPSSASETTVRSAQCYVFALILHERCSKRDMQQDVHDELYAKAVELKAKGEFDVRV
jgi:hypothetical protein